MSIDPDLLDPVKKEKIAIKAIKILYGRTITFPENATENRNAPFHEAFLQTFEGHLLRKQIDIPYFISLSSWLHGLATSIGTTFFEGVPHVLNGSEKKPFSATITESQASQIGKIMGDLQARRELPESARENLLIFDRGENQTLRSIDFVVDCFREYEDKIVAIEMKSVQPNSNETANAKRKILEAKAALRNKYPHKEIFYYLGVPFDPTSGDAVSFDKGRFMQNAVEFSKFFFPGEVLLAGELWDFLSGHARTMEQILAVIRSVATPDFFERFHFLNQTSNRQDRERYLRTLKEWGLISEMLLVEHDGELRAAISGKRALTRSYENSVFDDKGGYRENRFNQMKALLVTELA